MDKIDDILSKHEIHEKDLDKEKTTYLLTISDIKKISKQYAKQCCKETLKNANAELLKYLNNSDFDYTLEEILTDESNIILL